MYTNNIILDLDHTIISSLKYTTQANKPVIEKMDNAISFFEKIQERNLSEQ